MPSGTPTGANGRIVRPFQSCFRNNCSRIFLAPKREGRNLLRPGTATRFCHLLWQTRFSPPPQKEPSFPLAPRKVPRHGSRIRRFPRHGTQIFQNFHAMEPTFVPVAFPPARQAADRQIFHAMETGFEKTSAPPGQPPPFARHALPVSPCRTYSCGSSARTARKPRLRGTHLLHRSDSPGLVSPSTGSIPNSPKYSSV